MDSRQRFLQAYEQHSDEIFRFCLFRVFEREHAKDLVQEIFFRTWKYIDAGNSIDNIRAFLYRTARNLIIDNSRKKKESSLDELREIGFEPAIEELEQIEAYIDAQELIKKIQKLDDIYREAVQLRYIEDFSPKEIAAILSMSENLVSVRIHRGLKKLKDIIEHDI